jgi:Carboxypeptidase regulatory-like domain
MKPRVGKTAAGGLLAAAIVGLTAPLALAQQGGTATLTGAVAQCNADNEVPLANATISVDGASVTARSDEHGEFRLDGLPAPRVYTVTVASAGQTGVRPNISVQANQSVDVGVIDLGSVLGCGSGVVPGDTSPIPQVAPTFTPATQAQPTSTPAPTATSTPVPATPTPAPSDVNVPAPSEVSPPPPSDVTEPSDIDVPPSNTDLGPQPEDTSPDAGVTGLPGPDTAPGP